MRSTSRAHGLAVVLCLVGASLGAQRAPVVADSLLMPILGSRMDVRGAAVMRESRTVVIPTVLLYASVDGSMRASSQTATGAAIVTMEYAVTGLEKSVMREAARLASMDLADRLSQQGFTVLGYADVQANPLLARIERFRADASYGGPIVRKDGPKTTYAVVAPSDSQMLNGSHKASIAAFKALAKELNAVVVIPELWLLAPQLKSERNLVFGKLSARMTMAPGMDLHLASLTVIGPSGATGSIKLKEPLTDLSGIVGQIAPTRADSSRFGGTNAADTRMLGAAGIAGATYGKAQGGTAISQHSVEFVAAPTDYSRAVLRGAASFFQAVAAAIARK